MIDDQLAILLLHGSKQSYGVGPFMYSLKRFTKRTGTWRQIGYLIANRYDREFGENKAFTIDGGDIREKIQRLSRWRRL